MALIIANVDSRDFPYSRGDKIGDGGFGIVYLCYSKEKRAGSRKKYALKVVEKVRGPDGQRLQDLIMREAEILSKLDHPRIVALEAFFDLQRSYALVMEYVGGGELFYRFHAKKKYSEEDARVLVRNLLTAVAYLHKTGICHRDLKPENIVLADERNDTNIKLIDFGLAAHLPSKGAGNPYMVDFCGTPEYQAPEQLMRKPYTTKADNFAVGIIAYLLVSGYHPWKFFRLKATGKLVADGEFTKRMCYRNAEFHEEKWFGVTEECKDLVGKLLERGPELRLSASAALRHPWFNEEKLTVDRLASHDLDSSLHRIRDFDVKRRLRTAIQSVIGARRMADMAQNAMGDAGAGAGAGGGGGEGGNRAGGERRTKSSASYGSGRSGSASSGERKRSTSSGDRRALQAVGSGRNENAPAPAPVPDTGFASAGGGGAVAAAAVASLGIGKPPERELSSADRTETSEHLASPAETGANRGGDGGDSFGSGAFGVGSGPAAPSNDAGLPRDGHDCCNVRLIEVNQPRRKKYSEIPSPAEPSRAAHEGTGAGANVATGAGANAATATGGGGGVEELYVDVPKRGVGGFFRGVADGASSFLRSVRTAKAEVKVLRQQLEQERALREDAEARWLGLQRISDPSAAAGAAAAARMQEPPPYSTISAAALDSGAFGGTAATATTPMAAAATREPDAVRARLMALESGYAKERARATELSVRFAQAKRRGDAAATEVSRLRNCLRRQALEARRRADAAAADLADSHLEASPAVGSGGGVSALVGPGGDLDETTSGLQRAEGGAGGAGDDGGGGVRRHRRAWATALECVTFGIIYVP